MKGRYFGRELPPVWWIVFIQNIYPCLKFVVWRECIVSEICYVCLIFFFAVDVYQKHAVACKEIALLSYTMHVLGYNSFHFLGHNYFCGSEVSVLIL